MARTSSFDWPEALLLVAVLAAALVTLILAQEDGEDKPEEVKPLIVSRVMGSSHSG